MSRLVPNDLPNERNEAAEEMFMTDNHVNCTIMCDATWIYPYDPGTALQ